MHYLSQLFWLIVMLLVPGCITSKVVDTPAGKRAPVFSINMGANQGGIIENTDLNQLPNTAPDAFTGATNIGFHMGGQVAIPLGKNAIQTGVEYMFSPQTFSYDDAINNYLGTRKTATSQWMVPVTYNLALFRKKYSEGWMQIKVGYLMQFNSVQVSDKGPRLPDYKIKTFSSGLTFGIIGTPLHYENGSSLSVYADLYRGSRIYTDFYNSKDFEMPGSSFMRIGLMYRFK